MIRAVSAAAALLAASASADELCPRPNEEAFIKQPASYFNKRGSTKVEMSYLNEDDSANGVLKLCYVSDKGEISPTLRAEPGETITVDLDNEATGVLASPYVDQGNVMETVCSGKQVTAATTNIHFHGFHSPPNCHDDDVGSTLIDPHESYTYKIEVPQNQAPGLYWYQPYVHGLVEQGVNGGASGAVIIEGIEKIVPEVGGLPEQLIIIRDFERGVFPNGYDVDGPQAELSVNFVPVLYPDYNPAKFSVKPKEKQFWRIANAAGVTTLNLQLLYDGVPQTMTIVSVNSEPNELDGKRKDDDNKEIYVAPGGRVEIVVETPEEGVDAVLKTLYVNNGPDGDYNPERELLQIVASKYAPDAPYTIPKSGVAKKGRNDGDRSSGKGRSSSSSSKLLKETPSKQRTLVFSEILNGTDAEFLFTVDGEVSAPFSAGLAPALDVVQGTVEDWVIENRAFEDVVFIMNDVTFLVLEEGKRSRKTQNADSVIISSWDGVSSYPSATLRMDFLDRKKGVYVFNCHVRGDEEAGVITAVDVDTPCTKAKCNDQADSRVSYFGSIASMATGSDSTIAQISTLTVALGAVLVAVGLVFRKVLSMSREDAGFSTLDTTERLSRATNSGVSV